MHPIVWQTPQRAFYPLAKETSSRADARSLARHTLSHYVPPGHSAAISPPGPNEWGINASTKPPAAALYDCQPLWPRGRRHGISFNLSRPPLPPAGMVSDWCSPRLGRGRPGYIALLRGLRSHGGLSTAMDEVRRNVSPRSLISPNLLYSKWTALRLRLSNRVPPKGLGLQGTG